MNRFASRPQSGFAYIAAVVLLVVVAGLSVALLRLTTTQQSTINQGLLGAKASLAARGGIEWAFSSVATNCPTLIELPAFKAQSGFHVTVTCTYRVFEEGQHMVLPPVGSAAQPTVGSMHKRIYQIKAVACNANGPSCLNVGADSVAAAEYVERARVATACLVEKADGSIDGPCDA